VHIPAGYTRSMAERLSRGARLQVIEAGQGPTPLVAGHAVIARGGAHLMVERNPGGDGLCAVVDDDRGGSPYVPSIDRLFASAATATAGRVLGVVLTGMGDDGLRGARAIRAAGGVVLTESESSCVVYGMPREVWNAGLAQAQAPLEELPGLLQTHVGRRRS
jgi:two-component system, chemotaxis family, protein-glutamate methylesterase/glutaminase